MRWLKRLGVGLLIVLLVVAALWTWSRLRGPTPAQRAALELLDTPNAFEGRNAFDAIRVLPDDVPDAEIASGVNADMQALAAASAQRTAPAASTTASARYPDLRPRSTNVTPCGFGGADCLEKVRAAFDGYVALVDANARLIERVEALSAYDHHAWRLSPSPDAGLPAINLLGWPITAHAVRFAQGDHAGAVAATCRDLATWRRIGVHSDTLIVRMAAITLMTDGYGALLARMMAELPRDAPLPADCRAALAAPVAAEASICPAMRGELAWSTAVVDRMPEMRERNAWRWLVLDREGFRALMAEQMMAPCGAQAGDLQADQRPASSVRPAPFWRRFECVADSVGCILGDVAGPAYDSYALRGLDQNARLQLLGTLAWLRDQPDGDTLAERLARRPAELRSPARDITVTADGRSIEIEQYNTRPSATWSLPLPTYLVESTAASD